MRRWKAETKTDRSVTTASEGSASSPQRPQNSLPWAASVWALPGTGYKPGRPGFSPTKGCSCCSLQKRPRA